MVVVDNYDCYEILGEEEEQLLAGKGLQSHNQCGGLKGARRS
jgi:hypothetical protein